MCAEYYIYFESEGPEEGRQFGWLGSGGSDGYTLIKVRDMAEARQDPNLLILRRERESRDYFRELAALELPVTLWEMNELQLFKLKMLTSGLEEMVEGVLLKSHEQWEMYAYLVRCSDPEKEPDVWELVAKDILSYETD